MNILVGKDEGKQRERNKESQSNSQTGGGKTRTDCILELWSRLQGERLQEEGMAERCSGIKKVISFEVIPYFMRSDRRRCQLWRLYPTSFSRFASARLKTATFSFSPSLMNLKSISCSREPSFKLPRRTLPVDSSYFQLLWHKCGNDVLFMLV